MFIPFYERANKKEMNDIVKIDSSLAAMQLMLVEDIMDMIPILSEDLKKINLQKLLTLILKGMFLY